MSRVVLENDDLRLVVESVGGAISWLGRPDGSNLLAQRDWTAPVPASRSESYGDDELDFLSNYQAGWHELFPNAGAACRVLDTPMPFHGDVARSRWEIIRQETSLVTMACPTRLPVVLTRSIRLDGSALLIEEEARNESALPVPVLWGHHPVFPASPGMRIDLPGGAVTVDADWNPKYADLVAGATGEWPSIVGKHGRVDISLLPAGPAERLVYLSDLVDTWAAVRDPDANWGVAYCWDKQTFPYAWHWLQMGGVDFPWFGRVSYVAVEPQSVPHSAGLSEAIQRDEHLTLPPYGTRSTWLTASLLDDTARAVTGMTRAGMVSQGQLGTVGGRGE